MLRKRISLLMAVTMILTSAPTNSFAAYGAEAGTEVSVETEELAEKAVAVEAEDLGLAVETTAEAPTVEVPVTEVTPVVEEIPVQQTPAAEGTSADVEVPVTEAPQTEGGTGDTVSTGELMGEVPAAEQGAEAGDGEILPSQDDMLVENEETIGGEMAESETGSEDPMLLTDSDGLIEDWVEETEAAQEKAASSFDEKGTVIPQDAVTLEPGVDVLAEFGSGEVTWFTYTPAETAFYAIGSKDNSVDTKVWLYREQEGQLELVTEDDDGGNNTAYGNSNFYLSYELSEGNTYYYAVSHYNGAESGSCTVYFNVKLEVKGLSFDEPSAEMDMRLLGDQLQNISLTVNYGEKEDTLTAWTYKWVYDYDTGDSGSCLVATTDGQERIIVKLMRNSQMISMPSSNRAELAGQYTLYAYVDGRKEIYAEQQVIFGVPDAIHLILNQQVAFADGRWCQFTADKEGSYSFLVKCPETDGFGLEVYYETDGRLSEGSWETEEQSGYLQYDLEKGESIYFDPGSRWTGTFLVAIKAEAVSIELNQGTAITVDTLAAGEELEKLPVTVTFADDYTETVSDWMRDEWSTPYGWLTHTSRADSIYMKLKDSQGNYLNAPGRTGTDLPIGEYILEISVDNLTKEYPVTMTYAEETGKPITDGQTVDYTVPGKLQACYRFRTETAGDYVLKVNKNGGNVGQVSFYQVMEDKLCYVTGTTSAALLSADLQENAEYLLVIENKYNDNVAGTIKVTQKKQISSIDMPEEVSYEALSLGTEIRKYEATVHYTDGSEEVLSSWNFAKLNRIRSLKATTANNDEIYLQLTDTNGTAVNLPRSYASNSDTIPVGEYTLIPVVGTGKYAGSKVQISSVSVSAGDLQEGETASYDLNKGELSCYYAALQQDTAYFFYTEEGSDTVIRVLRDNGNTLECCATISEYTDSYSFGESGKYILAIYAKKDECVGNIRFAAQKQAKSISIDAGPEYEVAHISSDELQNLPVTITYADGETETVDQWQRDWDYGGGSDGSSYREYYDSWTDNKEYIRLYIEDTNGSYAKLGSSSIVIGEYTFKAVLNDLSDNKTINVGIPSDKKVLLEEGSAQRITVNKGEVKYFSFQIPEDTTKEINVVLNDNGMAYGPKISLYSVDGNQLCREVSGTQYLFDQTVSKGTYYLIIDGTDLDDGASVEGTVQLTADEEEKPTDKKVLQSISFEAEASYQALNLANKLQDLPVTVAYTDGTEEIISEWKYVYDWDENDNEISYLSAETDNGNHLTMALTDGTEDWFMGYMDSNSFSFSNSVRTGSVSLEVYGYTDSYEKISCSRPVEILSGAEKAVELPVDGTDATEYAVAEGNLTGFLIKPNSTGYHRIKMTGVENNSAVLHLFSVTDTGLEYFWTGNNITELNERLTAGKTYMVLIQGVNGYTSGTISCRSESSITDFGEIACDHTEWISGLDTLEDVTSEVQITYANGTSDTVELNSVDYYGNKISAVLYQKEAGAALNAADIVTDYENLAEGTYMLVVYSDSKTWTETPITVISRETAAEKYMLTALDTPVSIETAGGYYNCVQFTPEKTGTYSFESQIIMKNMRIFEAEGGELEDTLDDGYTMSVKLEEGKNYILALRAKEDKAYTLTAAEGMEIEEVQVKGTKTELIAGVDTLSSDDFETGVLYTNEDFNILQGSETDAYNNGFRYQITKEGSERVVAKLENSSTSLGVGDYLVKAIHRTLSAIQSSNEAAVHVRDINSVMVTDTTTGQEQTLETADSRQLFGFTPEETGYYRVVSVDSNQTINAVFYEKTADGVTFSDGCLTAGRSYLVGVTGTAEKQTFRIEMADKLTLDTAENVGVSEQESYYSFIPEESGWYCISAEVVPAAASYAATGYAADSQNSVTLSVENGSYGSSYDSDPDIAKVYEYLRAGVAYRIRLVSYGTLEKPEVTGLNCSLKVQKLENNTVTALEVVTEDLPEVPAVYAAKDSLLRFFKYKVTYDDETTETLDLPVARGHQISISRIGIEDTGDALVYTYRFTVDTLSDTVSLTFKKDISMLPELTENTAYTETRTDIQGYTFYRFTPAKDGDYALAMSSFATRTVYYGTATSAPVAAADGQLKNLKAGVEYLIGLSPMNFSGGGMVSTIKITKSNAVKDLKLLTPAQNYLLGIMEPGSGMTALVTYADGDTAQITAFDTADAYGNPVSMETRFITPETTRIYLSCGDMRVSCDVANDSIDGIPELEVNKTEGVTWGNAEHCSYTWVIRSNYSGVCTIDLNAEGISRFDLPSLYCVTDAQYETVSENELWMDEGKVYLYTETLYRKDSTATGFTVAVNSECIHQWNEGVITKEATCGEAGERTYTCELCGKIKVETIPATGAHTWDNGTVTVPATCAEAGVKTYTCGVCGETRTETIPATGAHNWRVVADKVATCTTAGSQHEECSVCHAKRNTTAIAATGHFWSAWTRTKAPTALAEGTDTRTCSKCGAKETRTVAKLKAYIKLNATSIILQMKQSTTAVKVTGMQTGDKIASWKSSNTKIVKVTSKGKITAQKKAGTAYVTVKLKSGKSAKIKVKVQKAAVATTKISGLKSKLTIKVKKSVQLKPTLSPITTKDKITYSSSNKKIATVSAKGKITAKKAGKVKITVKAGKKKFVITVTVKK